MLCFYCKNKLKQKKIAYNINRQGYDVILREIPAYVCQECGEIFFEEKSVDLIQKLINEIDEGVAKVKNVSLSVEKIKPRLAFS